MLLEFYNPGVRLPGFWWYHHCGDVLLQMLPVSYAGLALILAGIALMVAEAFSPSFGIFGLVALPHLHWARSCRWT
ncbi:hypothetical protein O9992_01955 [Vibrio lentus]|nr:hypothetical protein [Vibrio lentus]